MTCHSDRRCSSCIQHKGGFPSGRNYGNIPGINTTGGQCNWCGKYGHKPNYCPYLR
ncbi:hypothetical protein BCR42DRAFT_413767 [Absidia repens]|uniref:Uncharacterized protein n=1 Tax=Absidia repens TaxID=90262 RepID=A0A1X2II32_9FUNG|nr:hypothetical protein BCR42DRAFT_413767 [Absidia repens]